MANQQRSNETGTREPAASSRKLEQELRKLNASTEEEVDALKLDLYQEDEEPSASDGSGLVIDEIAEAEVAKFTEVGPLGEDRGAESLVPGRDNTSAVLRRHHPNTEVARSGDVIEGNLDQPQDEIKIEPKVDEGTAA